MAFLIGGANSAADDAYSVANSCRFNSGDSPYLKDSAGNAAPAGNRQKFTFSIWFKRAKLGATQILASASYSSGDEGYLYISSGDAIEWDSTNSGDGDMFSNMKLRDTSAWYHLVWSVDTTQSTAGNRMKFYLNGTQMTSWSTETQPNEDQQLYWNVGGTYYPYIGRRHGGDYFDGYIGEVAHVDNAQLAATSFGEFDEDSPTIWKPKDLSDLTFGTSGYWLDMEDSSDFGNDVSGVGNDFTASNLAATDQAEDSPTNNFCTMLPITKSTDATFTEGNLNVAYVTNATRRSAFGTMAVANGKWYWETTITATSQTSVEINLGISSTYNPELIGNALISTDGYSVSFFPSNGYLYIGNTQDESGLGNAAVNDIFGHALNMDDGTLQFYKNGSALGSANDITTSGSNVGELYPSFTPAVSCSSGDQTFTSSYNFGSPAVSISSANADGKGYGNFEYAPPSGFLAICTKNLGSTGG